jgi:hypothetical protein
MSTTVDAPVVSESVILGVINNIPIAITPLRKPLTTRGLREGERFHGVGFRVVSENGTPFTRSDLKRMNLPSKDAFGIRDFCESKLPFIFNTFLPSSVYDKNFHPGCCHLDENGHVHIIFNISGCTK